MWRISAEIINPTCVCLRACPCLFDPRCLQRCAQQELKPAVSYLAVAVARRWWCQRGEGRCLTLLWRAKGGEATPGGCCISCSTAGVAHLFSLPSTDKSQQRKRECGLVLLPYCTAPPAKRSVLMLFLTSLSGNHRGVKCCTSWEERLGEVIVPGQGLWFYGKQAITVLIIRHHCMNLSSAMLQGRFSHLILCY